MLVVKSVCLAGAHNLLRIHTQSDTKLCKQLLFYFYLMSFIYKENMKNIMNCIVLVQTSPSSLLAYFPATIE